MAKWHDNDWIRDAVVEEMRKNGPMNTKELVEELSDDDGNLEVLEEMDLHAAIEKAMRGSDKVVKDPMGRYHLTA